MKIVKKSFLGLSDDDDNDDDDEEPMMGIAKNDLGVFNTQSEEENIKPKDEPKKSKKESKENEKDGFKTSVTTEAFIKEHGVDKERLLMVSWDQRYRVINPGSLAHSGVLVQQKRLFSGSRKRKLQDKENPFLIAESKLPFIPLCMELVKNFVVVGGVGGKIIILNAASGACLLDMF